MINFAGRGPPRVGRDHLGVAFELAETYIAALRLRSEKPVDRRSMPHRIAVEGAMPYRAAAARRLRGQRMAVDASLIEADTNEQSP